MANKRPLKSGSNSGPLLISESSLQRQRWLPVPLNVNQLCLSWTASAVLGLTPGPTPPNLAPSMA